MKPKFIGKDSFHLEFDTITANGPLSITGADTGTTISVTVRFLLHGIRTNFASHGVSQISHILVLQSIYLFILNWMN